MRERINRNGDFKRGTFTRCLKNDDMDHLIAERQTKRITLVSGKLLSYQMPDGYSLQGGSTRELVDFHVTSTVQKSLSITLLLQGRLDFGYDHLMFHLNAESECRGVVVNLARPVTFCRLIHENNQVVKLHISLSLDWIASRINSTDPLWSFVEHHLDHALIKLNTVILTLANKIILLGTPDKFIEKIQMEVLTKSLLYEIFKQLNQNEAKQIVKPAEPNLAVQQYKPDPFDVILDALLRHIEGNLDQQFTVQQLAEFSAMSLSSLQRKFKQAIGYSPQVYIRRRRLEIAKNQLNKGVVSITEAAYNAGYRHPSNFTTAFKKVFGYAPRETGQY